MIAHMIYQQVFIKSRSCVLGLSILLLSACAGEMQDLHTYVDETKNKYQGSVEPLPQIEVYQSHAYNVFDLRDPFLNKVVEIIPENNDNEGPNTSRRKEPLEHFPLDSLKMVGTLAKENESWGLIQDPDGVIHPVKPGHHAGENYGEILTVTEDKITLLEIIPDGLGGWTEREMALTTSDD